MEDGNATEERLHKIEYAYTKLKLHESMSREITALASHLLISSRTTIGKGKLFNFYGPQFFSV